MTIAPPRTRRAKKAARKKSTQSLAKSVHDPVRKSAPKAKLQQPRPAIGQPPRQPERPRRGGTDPGPRNVTVDQQNPDLFIPPKTDAGILPNLRFSFADAHMRLERGGWTREITVRELPISTNMAGRRHAPQRRRHPRDALAQGSRVGVHALRQRARLDHR